MAFPSAPDDTATAEAERFGHAQRLMQLRRWTDARSTLHQLAVHNPREPRYRALLALARGHEASDAGDDRLARTEWLRAARLDPTLDGAHAALRRRRPRTTLLGRLFGRR